MRFKELFEGEFVKDLRKTLLRRPVAGGQKHEPETKKSAE